LRAGRKGATTLLTKNKETEKKGRQRRKEKTLVPGREISKSETTKKKREMPSKRSLNPGFSLTGEAERKG